MKKKYYIYTMNMNILNIFTIILLFLMFILTYIINPEILLIEKIGYSLILLFPYLIFHEILHSISYVIHGANFKNVSYGIHLEKGVMCCLCKENVSKRNILTSLIYPLFFIGIVTYIIGIIINSPTLVFLSIVNISGCSGDIIMFIDLIKLKNYEYTEYDDPTSFAIYTNEDLSNKKLFGLKYIKKTDKIDITENKKITISKFSIICLIILGILLILSL